MNATPRYFVTLSGPHGETHSCVVTLTADERADADAHLLQNPEAGPIGPVVRGYAVRRAEGCAPDAFRWCNFRVELIEQTN